MLGSIFLIFLSSLLLVLSFPRPDFGWFVWVGFIPLFFALENKSKKQTFWLSYLWGIFFWAGLIYWLVNVTLLGYIFLVLYLALYSGLFGLITSYELRVTSYGFLVLPCAWVSLEYLRSHLFTGFPWAILGYSQYKNLLLIQIADITGAYGVSFLIVLVNMAIYSAVSPSIPLRASRQLSAISKIKKCLLAVSIISVVYIYGYYKMYHTRHDAGGMTQDVRRPAFAISIVQGNIPPTEKWDAAYNNLILEKYSLLSSVAANKNSQLIVWPETSFPGFWDEEPDLREKVLDLAKNTGANFLIGAPVVENDRSYNTAIFISGRGEELKRYRKVHLVPFGEYIPLTKILGFLEKRFSIGDYARGKEFSVFNTGQLFLTPTRFSVLICFEDIFPGLVRRFVQEGAEFLINITEDGWYGKAGASFQHAQAAVFRAVENRRYLVRVANTGYSCFINSQGKIVSELKDKQGSRLFITGVHTDKVIAHTEKTFYSQWGDGFAFVCIAVSLYVALRTKFRSLKKA